MARSMLTRSMELLEQSPLSDKNKQLVLRFKDDCLANGLSEGRVCKYLWQLRNLGSWLKTDFDKAQIEDIKRLVAIVETSSLAPWTKCDYKVAVRKFYRWLAGGEECPKSVSWIRPRPPRGRDMMPSDLLTDDDVKKLISSADNPRDRALVALLYESGARIGELLGIHLKDLAFDKHGAVVMVNGKTGPRRIRLVSSVPFLTEWLNKHPLPQHREAPLWVTRDHRNSRLTYGRVRILLLSLRRRARIAKPVNPHHFRHSRATFLANHLTESQMKEYLGWVQGSEMAAVYVHLSGRDIDKAILGLHGLATDDADVTKDETKPKLCPRCEETNQYTNAYCSKCGLPLDEKAGLRLIQRDLERKRADELFDQLLEEDDFKAEFIMRLRKLVRPLPSEHSKH